MNVTFHKMGGFNKNKHYRTIIPNLFHFSISETLQLPIKQRQFNIYIGILGFMIGIWVTV